MLQSQIMENVCLFGWCLIWKCLSFVKSPFEQKTFHTLLSNFYLFTHILSFSFPLSCRTGLLLFPSFPFDLHTSLCSFLSLFELPLLFHEYLSDCYNWALIKLVACFPRKILEQIGLPMFTQMHVHPSPILLNYGVHHNCRLSLETHITVIPMPS